MDKPQRGVRRRGGRIKRKKEGGEYLYSTWREGEVTRQERMVDLPHLWAYKPANGSGGSSPGTAPGTQHRNTPHHVTTALHRILTANQHYSTATQLRLVHKRYTRKRVRVIGKQLLLDRKKEIWQKRKMLYCWISKSQIKWHYDTLIFVFFYVTVQ